MCVDDCVVNVLRGVEVLLVIVLVHVLWVLCCECVACIVLLMC
jgi:hypothetical protein